MAAIRQTVSGYAKLPKVNIWTDPRVFALLDEVCNRTCHGGRWMINAQTNPELIGKSLSSITGGEKSYCGLGRSKSLGRRKIPWSVVLSDETFVGGSLSSNEMKNSYDLPLLLSLQAQATLGVVKDTRSGKLWWTDYKGSELQLYEVEGSGLRAICISSFDPRAQ